MRRQRRGAADFILNTLRQKDGSLLKRYRLNESVIPGYLDDYASILYGGLIDLYEATFEVKYLKTAVELNKLMIDDFWDEKGGGFFLAARGMNNSLPRQRRYMTELHLRGIQSLS